MTPDPRPIALGGNTVYALPLAAGGWLLVDAGPDFDAGGGDSWADALAQARAHGFGPADVRTVLLTHAHIDHAGLAHRWADAGARILAGAADVAAVAAGAAHAEATRAARLDELRRHGFPAEALRALSRRRGRASMRWVAPPPDTVEAVEDGATFDLAGGGVLRVVAAPGHTPGNLVAFEERSGDLYSGDTLLPGTVPTPGLHFPHGPDAPRWPSLPPFIESVRRLRALPVRRVLPGHGAPVDAPSRLFDRFEAHHERRGGRIRALLAERPESAYGVARQLFRRLPEARLAQAMTEVIGHLDVLVAAGEARWEQGDGGVLVARLSDGA